MMKNIYLSILILTNLSAIGQWIPINIPNSASYRALRTKGDHIWAAGTKGTVAHSKNRGNTWEFFQLPQAEKLDFRDLAILSEQEIMLMSAGLSQEGKAILYYTKDEGKSWTIKVNLTEPGYFFDCLTWNPQNQNGWLLADPINQRLTLFAVSKDTARLISPINSPKLQQNEAFFAASGSSMIQLGNLIHFIGGGADTIKVYQYNIKRNSWTTVPLNSKAGEAKGYFSIGAKNNRVIWAAGGDYRKLNESSIPIITSQDGGKHWSPMKNSPNFYIEKVIWAKPFWIVSGPSQSAAYHEKKNVWKSLGESHYHNIIQVGDMIWGIGAKGQLGYISLSSIDQLFLTEK